MYECKVCFQTFSLLRYLRKHVSLLTVGDQEPNKCQAYYSNPGNLHEKLLDTHKIVTGNTLPEEQNVKTKRQQVQLSSISNQEITFDSKDDDDCTIIEEEHTSLKFEPDEQDERYYFDGGKEKPILQYNDDSHDSLQRSVNNEEPTKTGNHEIIFIENEKQDETPIHQTTSQRQNGQMPKFGAEKLDKLPVVHLAPVITNQLNPIKRRDISNKTIRKTRLHKCGICSKTFRSLGSLKRHQSVFHDGRIFICKICQKKFRWSGNLSKHKQGVHDGIRYECNICLKNFTLLENLNKHKSGIHGNVRYECDICQKEFNRLANLKHHKLSYHEQVRFKCDSCPKQFSSSHYLKVHKASRHEGFRYKCDKCEKEFCFIKTLKAHKSSCHDGVRYKCNICPKSFSAKNSLRQHKSVKHDQPRLSS